MSFDQGSDILKQDYLDVFEGMKQSIIDKLSMKKKCDIGALYLGTCKMRRQDELRAEQKIPMYMISCWMVLTGRYHLIWE